MTARWEARFRAWLSAPPPRAESTPLTGRPRAASLGTALTGALPVVARIACRLALGCLAGAGSWLGGAAPVGAALLAAAWRPASIKGDVWLAVGVAVGGVLAGGRLSLIPGVSAALMLSLRLLLMLPVLARPRGFIEKHIEARALLSCASIFAASWLAGPSLLYDRIVAIIEALAAGGFALVMDRAAEVLSPGRRRVIAAEDIAATALSLGCLLPGIANVGIGGFSPLRMLCMGSVALVAALGGAGIGASCGVAVGVVLLASGGSLASLGSGLSMLGAMAFSGWLAGSARRFGRIGAAVAQGAGMLGIIAWNGGFSLPINGLEWLIGALLAIAVPPAWANILRQHLDPALPLADSRRAMAEALRRSTAARLDETIAFLDASAGAGGAGEAALASAAACALRGVQENLCDIGPSDDALAAKVLLRLDQENLCARDVTAVRHGDALTIALELRCSGGCPCRQAVRAALSSAVGQPMQLGLSQAQACALLNRLMLSGKERTAAQSPGDDMYATLDAAMIDLHRREVVLWRSGAALGALVRAGKATLLPADSLPPGMVNDAEPHVTTLSIAPGDMLVQVSDGVAGAWEGDALCGLIAESLSRDAQQMAERMLSASLRRGGDDDRTVLVTRFYRTA